ncbi:hypothetical protein C7U89_03375 [Bradyrhizobium sp. WBOS4]|nr:hypothetical protein [Bradyrhizobium sp. WBOS8]MDD1581992.1 hypothetical protein [Bradyrhizobium sp. WBOS4]UUO47424.1 hypothetical protein DCM78_11095 [Bradyrhizobium sp. WBOS04]UUO61040.1 hypothetical protein DCM80_18835 [Bradyrhizobium sp. WBOS08]
MRPARPRRRPRPRKPSSAASGTSGGRGNATSEPSSLQGALATKQSRRSLRDRLDCFASLAMTIVATA